MTRWARSNSKKASYHNASSWKQLKESKQDLEKTVTKPINKDKRREHRRIKRVRRREANKVCFRCRMPGHGMADCPTLKNDFEQGFDICFKCGSTEHKANVCTAKLPNGQKFAYAKCFVCGETGHLSKSCPDNPKGLYPDGGCCPLCGSVEHYRKSCPERPIKDEVTVYRIGSSKNHTSVDDEISLYEELPTVKTTEKKAKIVKF